MLLIMSSNSTQVNSFFVDVRLGAYNQTFSAMPHFKKRRLPHSTRGRDIQQHTAASHRMWRAELNSHGFRHPTPLCTLTIEGRVPEYKTARIHDGDPWWIPAPYLLVDSGSQSSLTPVAGGCRRR